LPIAVPIDPSPSSYKEALAYVQKEFRINEVSELPEPPWTTRLI
jgi:hypothetical protein